MVATAAAVCTRLQRQRRQQDPYERVVRVRVGELLGHLLQQSRRRSQTQKPLPCPHYHCLVRMAVAVAVMQLAVMQLAVAVMQLEVMQLAVVWLVG
jgi:hypothetical protein